MTTVLSHTTEFDPLLDHLATRLRGRVVRPGDADYDRLAVPWNVAVPSTPIAVLDAAAASDVIAGVRFAADHALLVDVRATGHSPVPTNGPTLLVHTGRLTELTVHPSGWARVGAGVRWGQVLDAAQAHGLGALAGSAPAVGVVGYLTGGGLSPVGRTFGFGSDLVRAFEVVTGDGELRRVTPSQHADLFWGLRGGKGSLGIVTAVEFDLLPVGELYGGCLFFDAADTAAVLHAWQRWSADLPEQASTSVAILRLPPMPGVPEPLAGRCTLALRYTWVGDCADGATVFAPMRAVAEPILGGIATMPFAALGAIHADPVDPMPAHEHNLLLRELTAETVDALLAVAGPDAPSPQVIVELRRMGGALAADPSVASAVDHRDAAISLLTIGIAVPPVLEATLAHAAATSAALAPWSVDGSLPNFGGAADPRRVAGVYAPATLARLGELVRRYDPAEVLTGARAIRRATSDGQ